MSLLPTAACVVQGSNPHRTIIESVVQMQSSLRLIASEWEIKSTKCEHLERMDVGRPPAGQNHRRGLYVQEPKERKTRDREKWRRVAKDALLAM